MPKTIQHLGLYAAGDPQKSEISVFYQQQGQQSAFLLG
jgi:hypothetical protein